MGLKSANIRTTLSVRKCGDIFQSAPRQLMSGAAKVQDIAARLAGGNITADFFFTPQDASPFASLDDDPPTFTRRHVDPQRLQPG